MHQTNPNPTMTASPLTGGALLSMNRCPERGQLCPRDPNSTDSRTRLSALLLSDGPRLRCAVSKSWLFPMLLLSALGILPIVAEEPAVKVGDTFPAFADFSLEGEMPKDLKGKLVIVDFWASWCGPCRGTFPLMEELHRRLGKRGLVIVAVNEDKSRVAMTEFLKQHPVSFTVVRDAKKKLAARVNVAMLPASYILDGQGRVLAIQGGERTMGNRAEFIKLVEDLLEKHITTKP
jgi:thiol-disulfide isomerase/thioredoxin